MTAPLPVFRNATEELLSQSVQVGCGSKVAFTDETKSYSFDTVRELANRAANAFRTLGLRPHDRVVLCLTDSVDFLASFLGAIQAGIVPIPVNTLWSVEDYAHVLTDSGAKAAVVSRVRLPAFRDCVGMAGWAGRLIESGGTESGSHLTWHGLLARVGSTCEPH